MDTLTSFPQFTRLPLELQLLVWETAFRTSPAGKTLAPTMSKLQRDSLHLYDALPKWNLAERSSLTRWDRGHGGMGLEAHGNGLFFPHRTGVPDLLCACRNSRIAVLEVLKSGFEEYGPYVRRVGNRAPHERKMKAYFEGAVQAIDVALEQMRRA